MQQTALQEILFKQIKEKLPVSKSIVDAVSEMLHVSQDSAYRRIRGETPLVLEEVKTLCDQFSISLDDLLQLNHSSIVFENIQAYSGVFNFQTYLTLIYQQLEELNKYHRKSIIYITRDIPIFHLFSSRPVLAFRFFFWMKTVFRHPDFLDKKFSIDWLPAEVEELAAKISALYASIPSIEIWNAEGINSVLMQIGYYAEAGLITKPDVAQIHSGLFQMLEHLQKQTALGRKFLPHENGLNRKENFQFFYNCIGLGDNLIMSLYDDRKKLYINYDALSYMATTDQQFCNKTYEQLQTTMGRSTLISSVSEKQRTIFFNMLQAKIPSFSYDGNLTA